MSALALTAAERGRRAGLLPQAMAAIIRGRIRAFGRCTPQDLLRDGFTAREILVNQKEAWSAAGATGKEENRAWRVVGEPARGEEGGTPDRDQEDARRAQLAVVLAATRRPAEAPDEGGAPLPLRAPLAQLAALAGLGLFYLAVGSACLALGGAS